jgi:hypothetical protein
MVSEKEDTPIKPPLPSLIDFGKILRSCCLCRNGKGMACGLESVEKVKIF